MRSGSRIFLLYQRFLLFENGYFFSFLFVFQKVGGGLTPLAPPPARVLYFSFIYLPLIKNPHFRANLTKTFVNEISVRRFLPFTDGFFLSGVFSFSFHAPRDSPESKATFISQPINKEVGAHR